MLIARDAFIIGRISSINAQIGARERANRSRNPVIPCFCVIFGNSNRILQFVQESGRPNFKSIFLPQLAQ
ncbi:MAG: hypothetical protein SOU09_08835 [Faecalimonas umbilicata]|uniref:hypothetical protein n=1 Tax=Faecalimonas umbilicata TaxID=1912855 RepID=UPI002A74AF2F|nr:hypothetical protein [Faecalimonas umbilicata]MDY2762151.1 hypothetical protein [Faecalimonas umbilicata]